jgi:methionyl-tRNA formyltransferase
MRIGVIGGVSSTKVLLEKLSEHEFEDVHVWGYQSDKTENVSGWCDLKDFSNSKGYHYSDFTKVSDCEHEIKCCGPDILFVVGLSQIVPRSIIEIPKLVSFGFHPTTLPKGRGRAPIAWLILNETCGAATFFSLSEGVDDGPIAVQEFFDIHGEDDAGSIEAKILKAESIALDSLLPELKKGQFTVREQDHSKASWYGRRTPEDGWIDWASSSFEIEKLIRASTAPHPGAFTFSGDLTVKIWKARVINESYMGVIGRILRVENGTFVVQTGTGLLEVNDWSSPGEWSPRVGIRLGYYVESEVYQLRALCKSLQVRVGELEKLVTALQVHAV